MKEIVVIFVILASSVAMNRFGSPSAVERDAVLWQRRARAEQEQITREMLTVRDNINNRLEEMDDDNRTGRDLEALKTRLENENRDLQNYAIEATELTRDSWKDAKGRAETQVTQVKLEFQRVQKRMEKALSSND